MSITSLTLDDLNRALADKRHLGWGYATANSLSASKRDRLDRAVVGVANDLRLDYEGLFKWTNSKYGRWLIDSVDGNNGARASRTTVREHLNPSVLAALGWVAVGSEPTPDVRKGVFEALASSCEERDRNGDEIIAPESVEHFTWGPDEAILKMRDGRRFRVKVETL